MVDTLIINGVECEPYLTSDHRLMVERSRDVIEGVRILIRALGVRRAYIAIEKNKPGVREPATKCLQEIARTYFGSDISSLDSDPAKLKDWWRTIQERLNAKKTG
jgi:electron transport complex protein RnfC